MMTYRLSWWETSEPTPGVMDTGDPTGLWIACDEPGRLIDFVRSSDWKPDRPILIERHDGTHAIASVLTITSELEVWNADRDPMPRPVAGIAPPRYPSVDRAQFLHDLRQLVNLAVARKIITPERGSGLLLLADANTRRGFGAMP